jgi:hypothetical protein
VVHLGNVRPGSHVKLFILRVQSLAGERIPMLPADETAYTAGRSVDDPQTGGIS